MSKLRLTLLVTLLFSSILLYAVTWQARIIEYQKELIHTLQQDSGELLQRKMKDLQQKRLREQVQRLNVAPTPHAGVGCLPSQICG